jgi:hypothetical protein
MTGFAGSAANLRQRAQRVRWLAVMLGRDEAAERLLAFAKELGRPNWK